MAIAFEQDAFQNDAFQMTVDVFGVITATFRSTVTMTVNLNSNVASEDA